MQATIAELLEQARAAQRAEEHFADRDLFVRYVETEVNPARAAEGLSTCDAAAASHLYDVLTSGRYRS